MEPAVTERAWRRWNSALAVGGVTFGIALGATLVATALVLSAGGADTSVLIGTLAAVLIAAFVLAGIAVAAGRAVLVRRGAWGPPPSWGTDRWTRRQIAAALRRDTAPDLDPELAELTAAEATHTSRLGHLPAVGWTTGAIAQLLALALTDPSGLLLPALRVVAIVFCAIAGWTALITLTRARRYLDQLH